MFLKLVKLCKSKFQPIPPNNTNYLCVTIVIIELNAHAITFALVNFSNAFDMK